MAAKRITTNTTYSFYRYDDDIEEDILETCYPDLIAQLTSTNSYVKYKFVLYDSNNSCLFEGDDDLYDSDINLGKYHRKVCNIEL